MTLRNPWIDPRVAQVRAESLRSYLLRRGWKQLSQRRPTMIPFEGPKGDDVFVPLLEQASDYKQRVIEALTSLALAENRYAPEVLTEVLSEPVPLPAPGLATEAPTAAQPAGR